MSSSSAGQQAQPGRWCMSGACPFSSSGVHRTFFMNVSKRLPQWWRPHLVSSPPQILRSLQAGSCTTDCLFRASRRSAQQPESSSRSSLARDINICLHLISFSAAAGLLWLCTHTLGRASSQTTGGQCSRVLSSTASSTWCSPSSGTSRRAAHSSQHTPSR